MAHDFGRSVVHDTNGTWFGPETLAVTLLDEDQRETLEETGRMPRLKSATSDWAFGYIEGSLFESLARIVTLWLPDAALEVADDGELVIHTRLRVGADAATLCSIAAD